MFLIFAFILMNFEKTVSALTMREMEKIFHDDMIHRRANLENPLCYLQRGQKDTFCRAVFQRPHFKLTIQAEFNKQAFFMAEPKCGMKTTSFKTLNLPAGWQQNNLTCFGRHRIPRTNWNEDTFFDIFSVVYSPSLKIMYVFGEIRTGEESKIYIIDLATVKTDPFSLPHSKVTSEESEIEEYLYDIEVHDTNIHQVEATFIRDMVRNEVPFPDPFANMEPEKMLTVCLSVFTDIRYTSKGFFIDRQAMFERPYGPLGKSVYFHEGDKRDGHPQKAYPCRAQHESLSSSTKSLSARDMYFIAGGRKHRSIFIFEAINFEDWIRLVGYIENFDFENVLPSEPSETEIYANTQTILQRIQPSTSIPVF